jgi:hypothetical protein
METKCATGGNLKESEAIPFMQEKSHWDHHFF